MVMIKNEGQYCLGRLEGGNKEVDVETRMSRGIKFQEMNDFKCRFQL